MKSFILSVSGFILLSLLHWISPRTLKRTPEPHRFTDQAENASDYDRANRSIMILPYILALDWVTRIVGHDLKGESACDLCCGPGHFSLLLNSSLAVKSVTGVDMSAPALANARRRARELRHGQSLKFWRDDITTLPSIPNSSQRLVTLLNGAHHMETEEELSQALRQAERICQSNGFIFILDPVRPKTTFIANAYHWIYGTDYRRLGLHHFNQDFADSLHASWTKEELIGAIPSSTRRTWYHIQPHGFPPFQILIGLPEGTTEFKAGPGLDIASIQRFIPDNLREDQALLFHAFQTARISSVQPQPRGNDPRLHQVPI